MNPRRDTYWLLAALLFGVLVLPVLVHVTGRYVLGPYAGGGPVAFVGDYLGALLTLQWPAWVLALGPLVIVAIWRMLGRLVAASQA